MANMVHRINMDQLTGQFNTKKTKMKLFLQPSLLHSFIGLYLCILNVVNVILFSFGSSFLEVEMIKRV